MRKTLVSICLIIASVVVSAQMKSVVYFDASTSVLDASSKRILDTLVPMLKKEGKYKLSINGYCDCTGTHPSDTALGNDRAASVFNYLKDKGIPEDKMTAIGHAETTQPVPGKDPIGKFKNRRTEILITLLNPRPVIPRDTTPTVKPDTTPTVKPVITPRVKAIVTPPVKPVTTPRVKPVKAPEVPPDPASSLEGMKVGQKLPIKQINFVNDRVTVLPESMPALEQLLKYMQDNPMLEIRLSGYVCCTPDLAMSVARAKFVFDYLVKNGVAPFRMKYDGFSNKVPLLPNDNTDSVAARVNRRVEAVIIKK
jgi:outer membrane protein OmpA-like peptidoglycan-associated protein